ncbi:MAG: O-antigen ligase family protein [bacterium]
MRAPGENAERAPAAMTSASGSPAWLARTQEAGMILFLLLTPVTIAGSEIALGIAGVAWIAIALGGAARQGGGGGHVAVKPPSLASRLAGPGQPLLALFVIFAAALALASLNAFDRSASFAKMQKLLLALALFVFASGTADRARGRRLLAALLAGGLATSAYGAAVYLASAGGLAERLRGISGFYMTTAGVLMLTLLFLAPQVFAAASRARRLAALAALALVGWALVLTYTRGAWLGVLAGASVILALTRPRILLALGAALVASYFFLPASLQDRVTSIVDPNHPLNTERLHMWRVALRIVRDHPLTGAGLMDMKPLFTRYADPDYAGVVHGHFHSNFLQIAAATGAIGLAAFIALFAGIATALVRALRASPGPRARAVALGGLAAFTGFLVEGLFEWNFGDAEVVTLLYALIGIALAAPLWRRDERSNEARSHGAARPLTASRP